MTEDGKTEGDNKTGRKASGGRAGGGSRAGGQSVRPGDKGQRSGGRERAAKPGSGSAERAPKGGRSETGRGDAGRGEGRNDGGRNEGGRNDGIDGIAPRRAALGLLNAVLGEGRLLAQAVADAEGPLARLDGPGRARAQRLALAALRQVEPLDTALAPYLRKSPPLAVQNILRLAATELGEGVPAHAVVNAAVRLTEGDRRSLPAKGMVNAVLRRLAEAPPAAGAVQKLPRWLRQPLVHAWGREAVTAMEAVQAGTSPIDLTLREGAEVPGGELLPTGSLRLADAGQISALPGYAAGGWWVQDAAAALAVPLLAPRPGEHVLDLCAAPGGKTLQLAAAGAKVTALDISAARMARVHENLARAGLSADCVVADAMEWMPTRLYDAVLLDAPCSATGTIRRHPDLPFVKDGYEIAGLVELQARMIDRALSLLAPGGRLVFCTCSLLPEEGEGQITAALARHPGLRVVPPVVSGAEGQSDAAGPSLPGIEPAWISPQGGLRLRPDYWADRGGMDGFFIARLQRG